MKQVQLFGMTFSSIKDAAKHFNIPYSLMKYKIKHKLYDNTKFLNYKERKLCIAGVWYNSIKDACFSYHVTRKTIYNRINRGMTLEEAFTKPVTKGKRKKIEFKIDNKIFHNMKEIAKFYNINVNTFRGRLHDGYSVKEAIDMGKNAKDYVFDIDGQKMTIKQISEKYNIPITSIHKRLERGFSIQDVINTHIKSKYIKCTVHGKVFNSQTELLKYYDINLHQFYRVKRKLNINDVSNYEIAIDYILQMRENKKVIVNGVTYKNICQACKANNILFIVYHNRRQRGWSLEEALLTPPAPKNISDSDSDDIGIIV